MKIWNSSRKKLQAISPFVFSSYLKKTSTRYTCESVERIESGKLLWVDVIDIWLHEPGVFGRRISFRPSRQNMRAFLAENPEAWALFGKVRGLKK